MEACPYRFSTARAGLANPAQYLSKVVKCLDMSIQAEQGGVQLLPPAPGGLANPLKLGVICEQALLLTVDCQIHCTCAKRAWICLSKPSRKMCNYFPIARAGLPNPAQC